MISYNNFEEFKNCFNLNPEKFQNITQHNTPDRLGFSAFILPPEETTKKLGVENGHEYRTLFAVYFSKYRQDKDGVQPLVVQMRFALYDEKNPYGNYVLDYSYIKNKNKLPIEIYDDRTYYFDSNNKKICKDDNTPVDTKYEFNKLYDYHIRNTKVFYNKFILLKRYLLIIVPRHLIHALIKFLESLLWVFTGEKGISKPRLLNYDLPDDQEGDEELSIKQVDFLGLKVKPIPLFTYSMLHLIGYGLMFKYKIFPTLIKQILNYTFLTAVYVVTSYYAYTKIPELLLSQLIKILYRGYKRLERLELIN